MNHDIVAIGGSAGALNVILGLTRALTPDIAGSIFIAIHRSPEAASLLPEILSRTSTWPATHPLHGEKIKRGHIYVAPPDMHLMLRPGSMEIVRGPKENGHRPAVDALFRTAAASYRSRVIGVVLSGHQDCGTAGMLSIKARGGVSVVQDPLSSEVAEMPQALVVSPQRAKPLALNRLLGVELFHVLGDSMRGVFFKPSDQ